jgi:hypothetical protein
MSERTSGKGNTDAPRVEENEVRSGDGHLNQQRGSGQGMSYELSHGYNRWPLRGRSRTRLSPRIGAWSARDQSAGIT